MTAELVSDEELAEYRQAAERYDWPTVIRILDEIARLRVKPLGYIAVRRIDLELADDSMADTVENAWHSVAVSARDLYQMCALVPIREVE